MNESQVKNTLGAIEQLAIKFPGLGISATAVGALGTALSVVGFGQLLGALTIGRRSDAQDLYDVMKAIAKALADAGVQLEGNDQLLLASTLDAVPSGPRKLAKAIYERYLAEVNAMVLTKRTYEADAGGAIVETTEATVPTFYGTCWTAARGNSIVFNPYFKKSGLSWTRKVTSRTLAAGESPDVPLDSIKWNHPPLPELRSRLAREFEARAEAEIKKLTASITDLTLRQDVQRKLRYDWGVWWQYKAVQPTDAELVAYYRPARITSNTKNNIKSDESTIRYSSAR